MSVLPLERASFDVGAWFTFGSSTVPRQSSVRRLSICVMVDTFLNHSRLPIWILNVIAPVSCARMQYATTRRHQIKSAEANLLDDGIGDTLAAVLRRRWRAGLVRGSQPKLKEAGRAA